LKLVLALLILSFQVSANEKVYNTFLKSRLYFSSLNILLNMVDSKPELFSNKKKMKKLSRGLHPSMVIDDPRLAKLYATPSELDFFVGLHFLQKGDMGKALKVLKRLRRTNLHYAQGHFLAGLINYRAGRNRDALKSFKVCIKYSQRYKEPILKKSLRNRCIQYASRVHFSTKSYGKALSYLNYIKKDDYLWPRTLLDSAWAHFWMGNHGRALGKIVSYKAPILERFIDPEVYYLRTYIYYHLCYYKKAEDTYNSFEEKIKDYQGSIETFLESPDYESLYTPAGQQYGFAYLFFKGHKKDFKYQQFLKFKELIEKEKSKMDKFYNKYAERKGRLAQIITTAHNDFNTAYVKFENTFEQYHIDLAKEFIRDIEYTRKNMVKLKLLLNTKQRAASREGKEAIVDRTKNRLSLYEIDGSDDKAIYEFLGGFWADEIGDYAFALQSGCKDGER
jgi:hypothetical protein